MRLLRACSLLLPLLWAGDAGAGRPLTTDDAATAEAGTCQLEAWQDRQSGDRSLTLAPACGLPGGLELSLEAVQWRPGTALRAERGIGLKWAPESARVATPVGEAAFGLKLSAGQERGPLGGWQGQSHSALVLLSLQAAPTLAWHANLGGVSSRQAGQAASRAALAQLALAWTPQPRVLLFGEVRVSSRREVFGAAQWTLGARGWLVPERLGLDITTTRQAGAATSLGLGLGWYGIGN